MIALLRLEEPQNEIPSGHQSNLPTSWTMVRAAGSLETSDGREAFGILCERYRRPLERYVVYRWRQRAHEAEEHVQGFLSSLVERNTISRADSKRGKFRTFVYHCLDQFLIDSFKRQGSLKRGGDAEHVPIEDFESVPDCAPSIDVALSDLEWADAVLCNAVECIRAKQGRPEKESRFHQFRRHHADLFGEEGDGLTMEQRAEAVGVSKNTLEVAFTRFRKELGNAVREEVASTVDSEEEAAEELLWVANLLGRRLL